MGQTLSLCNSQQVVQRVNEADSEDDGMFGLRSLVAPSEQESSESEEGSSLGYPVSSRGSAYETAGSDEDAAEADDSFGPDLINGALPNEILWLIFSKLEEPRDWSSCAVVCRKWLSLLPSVIASAPSPDDLSLSKKERRRRQALQRQQEERRVILAGPVVSDTRLLALSVGAHGKNRVSKVEFVDCPKITDLGFSSLATACKDLRLVSISECVQLSGEAFSAIGECRGLEVLRLSETGVTDSALKRVARGCLLLQELSLSDCEGVGNEGLIHIAGGCKKLKRLELSGKGGLNDAGLRSMEIPTLKHFLLKRMRGVTERGLVSFMQGQSSRKLRTLTLSRSPAATDEALLQVACHCVSLRALTLSRCTRVTNKALEEIAARSVSLQHLTLLSCPGIGDQGLESVLSRSADTLEKLCVSKCKGVRDGHSLALAGPCNSMRVLELSGMPNMTDKCLAAIARACPNLQEVDCSKSAKVGDVGAMALAQTCSRSLKNVSLRGCSRVTDKSLAALSLCKLKVLVLSGCSISDAGLVGLMRSTCGRNLINLSVSKCIHITDASLPQLVHNLKNLWSLDIQRCPQITRHGVKLLNTGRFGAKCTILHSHSGSTTVCSKGVLENVSGKSSPATEPGCVRKRSIVVESRPCAQRASWKILMQ